jgi:hypothetical protein
MAPNPTMTWNWKWKAAATGATALAGWLASPPLQTAAPRARGASNAVQVQAAIQTSVVTDVEEQGRRLSARLAPMTASARPSRNPFRFGARPVARHAAAAAAPVAVAAPPVNVPVPFPLRLSGIAVDIVEGVEKRTAIISHPAGLELARDGESAAPGYRVVTVGESFAEVERLSDGARETLTLKP